jgi:hypothetical protein
MGGSGFEIVGGGHPLGQPQRLLEGSFRLGAPP